MAGRIALIGCGKMGQALLRGWLNAGIKASHIVVVEPSGVKNMPGKIPVLKKPGRKLKTCDIIVLAVKPQVMDDVCKSLKPFVAPGALVLSIAAGRSIKSLEKIFGRNQAVVRAMPNLPAAIGLGMTAAVANKNAAETQKKAAHKLLSSVGRVEWIKDEKLIDAVTAVSGSGPAYVFLLIEILARAAERAGLGKALSMTLARQTVAGSAALAHLDSKTDAATLRKNVTSPGGTTEAALEILMDGKMQRIFDRAVAKAKKRGRELSS